MKNKPVDKRGKLQEETFDFQVTKDQRVMLFWHGKLIKTVKGAEAEKLIKRLDDAPDETEIQLILAKATGNFKHGNERPAKDD